MIHDTEATAAVNPAEVCCPERSPAPCRDCRSSASPCVPAEVHRRDKAAASRAVAEHRAEFLEDRPTDEELYRPSGPYRDDLDDFCPTAADEEWRLMQLAADHERFVRLFARPASVYRYVDEGPDADWAAAQFAELARLARATDAADVSTMIDRLLTLSEQFA